MPKLPVSPQEELKRRRLLEQDAVAYGEYLKSLDETPDPDIQNTINAELAKRKLAQSASNIGDKIKSFFTGPSQQKDPAQEFNKFLGRQPAAPQPESLPEAPPALSPEDEMRIKAKIDAMKATFDKSRR